MYLNVIVIATFKSITCKRVLMLLDTYMPLVIQFVVGQFQLVKADHLTHPRLSGGWGVRVDVDPGRHWGVCVPRHHPLRAVVHVPSGDRRGEGLWSEHTRPSFPL